MEKDADGRVRITKDIVEKVIQLKSVDLPSRKIANLLGISQCSVSQIKAAGSWEGWQQFKEASKILAKKRHDEQEKKQKEIVQAWDDAANAAAEPADSKEYSNEDIIEQLKEINLKLDQLISIQTNTMPSCKNNTYKPF